MNIPDMPRVIYQLIVIRCKITYVFVQFDKSDITEGREKIIERPERREEHLVARSDVDPIVSVIETAELDEKCRRLRLIDDTMIGTQNPMFRQQTATAFQPPLVRGHPQQKHDKLPVPAVGEGRVVAAPQHLVPVEVVVRRESYNRVLHVAKPNQKRQHDK